MTVKTSTHYYNDNGTQNQYRWNHFQNIFFTIKTVIDNQN